MWVRCNDACAPSPSLVPFIILIATIYWGVLCPMHSLWYWTLLSMRILTLFPLSYSAKISTILMLFLGCFGSELLRNTFRTLIIFERMQETIAPSAAHSIIEGAGKRNKRGNPRQQYTRKRITNVNNHVVLEHLRALSSPPPGAIKKAGYSRSPEKSKETPPNSERIFFQVTCLNKTIGRVVT
jgi:hypothetical protein